jgi:hypothetical protein
MSEIQSDLEIGVGIKSMALKESQGKLKGGDDDFNLVTLICITLLVIGLNTPCLYYAFQDEDSTCQEGTRGGLILSTWLKVAGFSDIVLIGSLWIIIIILACKDIDPGAIITILIIVGAIFKIIWFVWGIVVISTNENNRCVSDGKGMAVMAIIWLCLSWDILFGS